MEELGSASEELSVMSSTIWPSLSIPVCWETSTPIGVAQGWVKDQVKKTWETSSRVRFTGWGACTANAKGIRIRVAPAVASTGNRLGRQLDAVKDGLTLNLTMTGTQGYVDCANNFGIEKCVRATSVHEFGHALGFTHEQMRFDNPDFDCLDLIGGDTGDVRLGAYDKLSIMRSCNVRDLAQGTLSAEDKLGLQAFYGNPGAATVKKDAVKWDDDTLYFFFGDHYIRYSLSQDRIADLWPTARTAYPAPTFGNWPQIPQAFAAGIDAALKLNGKAYMFRGKTYIQYDVANDAMDSGFPKNVSSAWAGLPSAWTGIDAAIAYDASRIYFFRGSEYVRYDIPANCATTVDKCGRASAARPIVGNWPGLTFTNLDYVVEGADDHIYFFKGTQYVKYYKGAPGTDEGEGVVGSVRDIFGAWKGVTF